MLLKFYIVLATLQILDAYTTYKILKAGGSEQNKILTALDGFLKRFTKAKWAWLVIAKVFAILCGWLIYDSGHQYALILMIFLCAFYVWVVIHNFMEMKKNGI